MSKTLLKVVESFSHQRILVVGDLVLDQFLYGEISRISREAPVLILRHKTTVNVPGGGGNAAMNVRSLGGQVVVAGTVAADDSGRILTQALEDAAVSTEGVVCLDSSITPTKTRIMGGLTHASPQQIVRVDRDELRDFCDRERHEVLKRIEEQMDGCTGVVISDYGYGMVTESLVDRARLYGKAHQIPVVADSRFRLPWFRSITAMTPNVTEVEEAYRCQIKGDLAAVEKWGHEIIRQQDLQAILITRGRHGLSLIERDGGVRHIPVFGSDQVSDVTGAGDTVIAAFALALASGGSFDQAAVLSNLAGGIVVMKRGTATVSQAELRNAAAGYRPT